MVYNVECYYLIVSPFQLVDCEIPYDKCVQHSKPVAFSKLIN